MLSNLFLKTLRDQMKAVLGWGLGLAALALLTILFYPSVQSLGDQFEQPLKQMPELAGFLGDVESLTTIEGYVTSQILSYMPVVLAIYATLAGTSMITGEIEGGTMDLIMAHPISRWQVVLQKYAALVVSIIVICLLFGLGMVIAGLAIGADVTMVTWLLAALNVVPITVFYASIAFVLSCFLRGRGIPIGVTIGLVIAGFILSGLAPMVAELEPYREFTIYYLFTAGKPFSTGLVPLHLVILVIGSLLLFAASLFAFERRDITR